MEKSKSKKIIFAVVLLVVALGITLIFSNPFGGGPESPSDVQKIPFLCVNEKCGHTFGITPEEYDEQRIKSGRAEEMGPVPITCPKCGEESAFPAMKCEKCGETFIADPTTRDYPDRCPKCGYSPSEGKRKRR